MEVNDALIDNLSNLARLEFNAVEKEAIKHDLQRMIQFVEKLGERKIPEEKRPRFIERFALVPARYGFR